MAAVMQNGLSVQISWLIASQTFFSDPTDQARYHIKTLLALRAGDVATKEDVALVLGRLEKASAVLPIEGRDAEFLLAAHHPRLTPFLKVETEDAA